MQTLTSLLRTCRHSTRLIQSVALAFVLSLGVAIAAPAVQAHNLTPDQQIICVGAGGMKLVTFAADGVISDTQTLQGSDCPLCAALQALPPTDQSTLSLPSTPFARPIWRGFALAVQPPLHAPPARAPPLAS
jgi:hypothetical protein